MHRTKWSSLFIRQWPCQWQSYQRIHITTCIVHMEQNLLTIKDSLKYDPFKFKCPVNKSLWCCDCITAVLSMKIYAQYPIRIYVDNAVAIFMSQNIPPIIQAYKYHIQVCVMNLLRSRLLLFSPKRMIQTQPQNIIWETFAMCTFKLVTTKL